MKSKTIRVIGILGCIAAIAKYSSDFLIFQNHNSLINILFYGTIAIIILIQIISERKKEQQNINKNIPQKKKHKKFKFRKKKKGQIIQYDKFHDHVQAMWDELD